MTITQESPDIDDFQDIDWQNTLKKAEELRVDKYHSIFFEKAEDLENDDDSSGSAAYRLLGDICTMYLKDDNPDNPFGPLVVTTNGRSAIVDDFNEDELDVLNKFLDDIEDPELLARVADVLWTSCRDYKAAETAFYAYLESAEVLFDPSSWSNSFQRIERAFQIATMLQNEDLRGKGRDFALKLLNKLDGEDSKYLSCNLLKLLLEHNLGELDNLSQRANEAAEKAEEMDDWEKAKKLWMLKADIDKKYDGQDAATEAEIRAGECIVKRAEVAQRESNSVAAYHFAEAVEVFRRAGASEKAEQTHEQLLDTQKKSVDEMGRFGKTVDLSDAVQDAREAVSDKSLSEALITLALITTPPKKEEFEQQTEQVLEDNTTSALLPATIVNDEGKIVAKHDSVIGADAEEEAIRAETIKNSQRQYLIEVKGRIEPAREQLIKEHRVTLRDFSEICGYNPFVPPGRETIFAQGLYRGFTGEFTSASHLLIPQIEHSLRYLLKHHGVITSSLRSDGIQEEYSLGTLLDMDELEEILGKDIVFTLHSLLNSKFGANFRHQMAHGLLDSNQFNSPAGVYIWWLVLHLLFIPVVSGMSDDEEGTEQNQQ